LRSLQGWVPRKYEHRDGKCQSSPFLFTRSLESDPVAASYPPLQKAQERGTHIHDGFQPGKGRPPARRNCAYTGDGQPPLRSEAYRSGNTDWCVVVACGSRYAGVLHPGAAGFEHPSYDRSAQRIIDVALYKSNLQIQTAHSSPVLARVGNFDRRISYGTFPFER